MLALRAPPPPPSSNLPSKPKPKPRRNPNFPSVTSTTLSNPRQFRVYAQNDNKNNGPRAENGFGNDGKAKNGRLRLNLLNLVIDPDPENVVAVGLTGLLTWASVQVLWQLVVVSAAIVIAAVKYSVVAALLIFILITLL